MTCESAIKSLNLIYIKKIRTSLDSDFCTVSISSDAKLVQFLARSRCDSWTRNIACDMHVDTCHYVHRS